MSRSFQMKAIVAAVSLLIGLSWNVQPAQAQADTITIAAANSLKDALRKVLPLFEAEHRSTTVRVIYGPSQTHFSYYNSQYHCNTWPDALLDNRDTSFRPITS